MCLQYVEKVSVSKMCSSPTQQKYFPYLHLEDLASLDIWVCFFGARYVSSGIMWVSCLAVARYLTKSKGPVSIREELTATSYPSQGGMKHFGLRRACKARMPNSLFRELNKLNMESLSLNLQMEESCGAWSVHPALLLPVVPTRASTFCIPGLEERCLCVCSVHLNFLQSSEQVTCFHAWLYIYTHIYHNQFLFSDSVVLLFSLLLHHTGLVFLPVPPDAYEVSTLFTSWCRERRNDGEGTFRCDGRPLGKRQPGRAQNNFTYFFLHLVLIEYQLTGGLIAA